MARSHPRGSSSTAPPGSALGRQAAVLRGRAAAAPKALLYCSSGEGEDGEGLWHPPPAPCPGLNTGH